MALLQQEPRPRDPLVDRDGNITYRWGIYFDALLQTITQQPTLPGAPVAVPGSEASILATPLSLGTNNQGLFRVSWWMRVVTPGTVSGQVQLTIRGTDKGVTYPQASAVMNGNTTDTVLSGSFIVRRDQGTAITYETNYASVGATQMAYDLVILVEVMSNAVTT